MVDSEGDSGHGDREKGDNNKRRPGSQRKGRGGKGSGRGRGGREFDEGEGGEVGGESKEGEGGRGSRGRGSRSRGRGGRGRRGKGGGIGRKSAQNVDNNTDDSNNTNIGRTNIQLVGGKGDNVLKEKDDLIEYSKTSTSIKNISLSASACPFEPSFSSGSSNDVIKDHDVSTNTSSNPNNNNARTKKQNETRRSNSKKKSKNNAHKGGNHNNFRQLKQLSALSSSSSKIDRDKESHGNNNNDDNDQDYNRGSNNVESLKKKKEHDKFDMTIKGNDNNNRVNNGHGEEDKSRKKRQNKTDKEFKGNNNEKKNKDVVVLPSSILPPNRPQLTNDINYGRNEAIVVLHVAEKPSISLAIAKGLRSGSENDGNDDDDGGGGGRGSGGRGLPVHNITGPVFPKAPKASSVQHRITSVAGHVFNVDFPSEYQSWDSVDPAELFHAPIKKTPCKGSIVKHLQDCARNVDFIVLWLDCDREGENIAFEVLDCCMHLMNHDHGVQSSLSSTHYDRVYRAYFSAINGSDIRKAYNSLGKPDKNQSLSVDVRQELDLKVGVAFSRFQTKYFQGRYGDLDSGVLSYGPCQTPTLGFCVKRHLEILTFKPEPYWILDLGVYKKGRVYHAQWEGERSFNQQKIIDLAKKYLVDYIPTTENKDSLCHAIVRSNISKEKKQTRPIPLNTVNLLKACSKALNIGPHQAMQTAERLYLSGYLSYPRTESTAYPDSFDVKGTLQCQTSDRRWGSYVCGILREGLTKSRGGIDMGDHPPITPCRSVNPNELSGDMSRMYELVTRHFIASVSQDAVWKSTKVELKIEVLTNQDIFSIRGKELVSPGFLAVFLHKQYGERSDDEGKSNINDKVEDEEERALPDFFVGEKFPLSSSTVKSSTSSKKVLISQNTGSRAILDVKEKITTPPTHLTESELITLMERYGIGTDASIATHIENVQKRNYCTLQPGRKMLPSKLGLVLAQGYHIIDSSLVLPEIRSEIEDQCTKIAKGLANKDEVLEKSLQIFENKFHNFVEKISKMDVLFSSSFSQLQDVGKTFTRCGLSSRYLQYIAGPPPRLYNKFTETVYPLPAGGMINEWTGKKCSVPTCNFELCLYSVGQPPRSFPLCPYCFNNPQAEWGKVPGDIKEISKDLVDREDESKERTIRRIGGRSLILECPHPDKHPLIEELTVSPDGGGGVLIMDPHFGPKWRLVSTREPTIVYLPKSVEKVTILDKQDNVTGCRLMKIHFTTADTPLDGGVTKLISCFPTDELLQNMVRVYHGTERLAAKGGRGRGRGRGRGEDRGRGKVNRI